MDIVNTIDIINKNIYYINCEHNLILEKENRLSYVHHIYKYY